MDENNEFYIPTRKNLLWLAVDLDGTLAYPTWKPDQTRSVIGNIIPENVAKLREAVDMGYKAVIHTARPSSDYEMIEAWVEHHNLPISRIITGKILAHKYIDDKAIDARSDRWY